MVQAMQGWLQFPFRLIIALGVAYLISSGMNSSESKLDFSFLSRLDSLAELDDKPAVVEPMREEKAAEPISPWPAITMGALILYVWFAYEWVGFARFDRTCRRLRKLGATIHFDSSSEWPLYHYYFRSETTIELCGRKLHEEYFELLKALPNVNMLKIENAWVPDDFAYRLFGLKKLKRLFLRGVSLPESERRALAPLLVH